ncbi:hypothetical protein CAPTEDRAFT_145552, partial [Capitella teleta]
IKASGSLHEFLMDIHADYGPMASFLFGPQLVVSICCPDLYKQYLKTFDRPASLFEFLEPLITANSIQFANGAEGRMRHSAYMRSFGDSMVKNYYPMLQKFASDLTRSLQLEAKETHIPLRKYMFAFAIKAMLRGAYGKYFDSDEEIHKLRAAYDVCWTDLEHRLLGDLPVEGSKRDERFEKNKKIMYDIMQKVLDDRRSNPPENDERCFVDALIDLDVSEDVKKSDMLTVLIAGFHTTGLLLTWCLYYLAKHEEIQDKLLGEIEAVLGKDGVVKADNVHQLPYLRQVLNESLRCSVLAPFAARVQSTDVEIGGHTIPANTPVLMALGVTLCNDEFYPDPEIFDPERFTEENMKNRPSLAFEPFGFGKRKCLGYKFSMAEFSVLIPTLIRHLKVELVPGQVVTPMFGLVTTPTDEIWVTVSERK